MILLQGYMLRLDHLPKVLVEVVKGLRQYSSEPTIPGYSPILPKLYLRQKPSDVIAQAVWFALHWNDGNATLEWWKRNVENENNLMRIFL